MVLLYLLCAKITKNSCAAWHIVTAKHFVKNGAITSYSFTHRSRQPPARLP